MTTFPTTKPGRVYASTWIQRYGGRPPYAWDLAAGALPGGLALDPATGVVSGTVLAGVVPGAFGFTARLTDGLGRIATKAFSITVDPLPPGFIWAPDAAATHVDKYDPTDGYLAGGPYATPLGGWDICYDGVDSLWVTTCAGPPNNKVYKISKATGAVTLTLTPAPGGADIPTGICSDGTYIYVAVQGGGVMKYQLDGTPVWTSPGSGGFVVQYCCADLHNNCVWVACSNNWTIKRRMSDGASLGNIATPANAQGVCYDAGSDSVWVTSRAPTNGVRKLRGSDGGFVADYGTGTDPVNPVSDGTYIYIGNRTDDTVTKRRASDGALIGTYAIGAKPYKIHHYDGSLWLGCTAIYQMRCSDMAVIKNFGAGYGACCNDLAIVPT